MQLATALVRSGLDRVAVWLLLGYDADGRVTEAAVVPGTGNAAFDQAISQWGRKLVVRTNEAGVGRLQMAFKLGP